MYFKFSVLKVAITTDGWSSRATESYITITSSHIDDNWELKNYVLQTRAMPESHTGMNLSFTIIFSHNRKYM